MKNITKTLQILLIIAVILAATGNFVIAQEGPDATPSEESDQSGSNSETPDESGPVASNSTEEDQTDESNSNTEGPGASNSTEDNQTDSSNTQTPEQSASTPSEQSPNTSYNPLTGSCSSDLSSITSGQSISWTVEVEGGNGLYSYNWSGDDGISGTTKNISHTYNSVGTFSANVEVSSPAFEESENLNLNCGSVEVSEDEEETTTTSTGGSSSGSRRVSNNNNDDEEIIEDDEEDVLTEEEIIAFLQTLTPQETVGDIFVTTENNNDTDNIDSENQISEESSENDSLNEGDTEGDSVANADNNQLAAIGGINLDWLDGLFDGGRPILWFILILAALGISYATWKKYKSNK